MRQIKKSVEQHPNQNKYRKKQQTVNDIFFFFKNRGKDEDEKVISDLGFLLQGPESLIQVFAEANL